MAKEKRCVECGHKVNSLFVQYSPGNVRLVKCDNCQEIADEYIECELMIIFIDLILHKPKAYRHLLYNFVNGETIQHLLWKLVFAYLLLDAYRNLLLLRNNDESSVSVSLVLASIKVLVNVLSANFAFIFSFAFAVKIMLVTSIDSSRKQLVMDVISPEWFCRRKEILSGILISSYIKIFLFALPVWDFPILVIFIVDILVSTSNIVALKVITESTTKRCVAACFIAHLMRFLADQIFCSRSLKHLQSVMYLSSLLTIV